MPEHFKYKKSKLCSTRHIRQERGIGSTSHGIAILMLKARLAAGDTDGVFCASARLDRSLAREWAHYRLRQALKLAYEKLRLAIFPQHHRIIGPRCPVGGTR